MKVIFLIGEAKAVLDLWSGKTKKGKRTLAPSRTKLNGSSVFDGEIIERRGEERRFQFLFVALESGKARKIPEMMERLDLIPEESAVIVTDNETGVAKDIGVGTLSGKRYHAVGPCKLFIVLKGSIKIKDVNELAAVLFLNHDDEMSRRDGRLKNIL